MKKREPKLAPQKLKPPSLFDKIPINSIMTIAVALILIIAFNLSIIKKSFRLKPLSTRVYQDNINDSGEKLKRDAQSIIGDFSFSSEGVVLRPGQSFAATYRFDKDPEEEVFLELWFFRPSEVSNRLDIIRPDGRSSFAQNANFQGAPPLNLTEQLRGFNWFSLKLFSELSASAPDKPTLIYDGIKINFSSRSQIPPLPVLGYMLVFSLGIFLSATFYPPLRPFSSPLSLALLFLHLLKFAAVGEKFITPQLLAIISLAIAIFTFWRFARDSSIKPLATLLLLFIIAIALDYRWKYLTEVINKPLDPDAITYIAIARGMKGPFDTDFREPFFMWLVKLFFLLFRTSEVNLRLLTLFASLITIYLTYIFASRITKSPAVGLVSAFILAQGAGYVYQNLRGLRLEIYLLTIIPFIYVLLQRNRPADWKYAILVGFLAGLNQLNNLSAMSFCLLLILYFAFRQKWKPWLIPLPIIFASLLTLPHLLHNKKQFGDAFYSANIHARYYRNQEFKGQPGFPTVEEVRKNGYCGSPITTFQYFFGLHTLPEIIRRTLLGFKLLYFGELYANNFFRSEFLFYFYILGLIFMLFYRPDFLVCFLLLSSTSLFLIGTFIYFDVRLTMHIIFMSTTLSAFGIVRAIHFLQQKLKP